MCVRASLFMVAMARGGKLPANCHLNRKECKQSRKASTLLMTPNIIKLGVNKTLLQFVCNFQSSLT